MKTLYTPKTLRTFLDRARKKGQTVGFVPTMGALHSGHVSLVRKARQENDLVVVSIFVNPTQFGPKEDFKKYPRRTAADKQILKKEKVDVVFMPQVETMYPQNEEASIRLKGSLSGVLCGKYRPGHFEGVATIVTKLFMAVGPGRAYFGAKDYQQYRVIERLVRDLSIPVKLRLCPIVREADGLALSSRNRYLKPSERVKAACIQAELVRLKQKIKKGKTALSALKFEARKNLKKEGLRVQYFDLVDPETLVSLRTRRPKMLAAVACFVGKTRLIDNAIIKS